MDGLAPTNLKGIKAPVNFTAPMDEKPYSYNYDPGPGIALRNTENEEHTVTVYDARGLRPVARPRGVRPGPPQDRGDRSL